MKNIISLLQRRVLENNLKASIYRFPLPFVLSILVTLILFYLIWATGIENIQDILVKLVLTSITIFLLSTGVSLFMESERKRDWKSYMIYQTPVLVFGVLFYWGMDSSFQNFNSIVYIILTLVWIISFIFFAPYTRNIWTKKNIEHQYFHYFYKISVVFFVTAIVWWALSLLGNGAILSIENLFDFRFSNSWNIYGYWTTLALAFMTPLFFLSELPQKKLFQDNTAIINVFLHFLVKYILIPFIYIYFIILYAYSVKVLLNFWDWPKGEVSWMVILFSILWYFTYIFSAIFEEKTDNNTLVKFFRKYFPYAVIPQLAMLFYAIALRIGQYDITINRYFVVAFGLWLLGTSLYLILSQKKSLLYIPAGLTLITLVISIGPWSVYSLPLNRQFSRLINNLEQANILQNGEIIPLENYTDIDNDLSKQIYDAIEYVCNYDNCEKLRNTFPVIMKEIDEQDLKDYQNNEWNYSYYNDPDYPDLDIEKPEYIWVNSWEYISEITAEIKVQSNSYTPVWNDTPFINITGSIIFPMDITWYNSLTEIHEIDNAYNSDEEFIRIKDETLSIKRQWVQTEVIDISYIFSKLRAKKTLSSEDTFDIIWKTQDYKLIISNAYIPEIKIDSSNSENTYFWSISGYILIKNK